uniref:Uncharacterized protein n=1 Tax=Glossina pallidipes TaxID=7398 RepID=A0A1A9ZUC3_GLOPL
MILKAIYRRNKTTIFGSTTTLSSLTTSISLSMYGINSYDDDSICASMHTRIINDNRNNSSSNKSKIFSHNMRIRLDECKNKSTCERVSNVRLGLLMAVGIKHSLLVTHTHFASRGCTILLCTLCAKPKCKQIKQY